MACHHRQVSQRCKERARQHCRPDQHALCRCAVTESSGHMRDSAAPLKRVFRSAMAINVCRPSTPCHSSSLLLSRPPTQIIASKLFYVQPCRRFRCVRRERCKPTFKTVVTRATGFRRLPRMRRRPKRWDTNDLEVRVVIVDECECKSDVRGESVV